MLSLKRFNPLLNHQHLIMVKAKVEVEIKTNHLKKRSPKLNKHHNLLNNQFMLKKRVGNINIIMREWIKKWLSKEKEELLLKRCLKECNLAKILILYKTMFLLTLKNQQDCIRKWKETIKQTHKPPILAISSEYQIR